MAETPPEMKLTPPDMEQAGGEAPSVATRERRFPCAQCGAKLIYKPGTVDLKCEYCGHVNHIPQSEDEIAEVDFAAKLAEIEGEAETVEATAVKCTECGAETVLKPGVTAGACAFCGAEVVATGQAKTLIKPKSLLPFELDGRAAREAYGKWLAGLWFAPGEAKKFARVDGKLSGVYVPYWTYDADTSSFYRGQRGDNYTETQHYTAKDANGKTVQKTRQVTKTRWTSVSGTVWRDFDDVLILASDSLPKKYTDKLEPWDLKNLVPYQDEYLSGFKAECYHVGLAAGFGEAKEVMDEQIRSDIRDDIGGDKQRIDNVRTAYDDVTFKHILLPIWLGAFRYRGEVYQFVINARTGEVQGERPWSWLKIGAAVLGGLAVAAVVVAIVMAVSGS